MKKNLTLLLLLVFFSSISNSAELIPLESYVSQNSKWYEDTTEMAYFGARCTCLYTLIGTYFVENAAGGEDKDAGRKLLSSSNFFNEVAVKLSFATNMNENSIKSRYQMITKSYTDRLIANKQLNNNMFDDFMKGDVTTCSKYSKMFEELSKQIK